MWKVKLAAGCWLLAAGLLFMASGCGPEQNGDPDVVITPTTTITVPKIPVPDLNADSAYAFVKAQVDFGPRVPGTKEHENCANWLVAKLKSYGLETMVQKGPAQTYDKKNFTLKNIIGTYNPTASKRIIVCSHWDTRHICESDSKDQDKPGDGANDGASGVGVALEIARQLSIHKPDVGVDIIFFDIEDYGTNGDNLSWCLGSQYWAANPHKPGYYADFGILLDMVGAPNAIFPKEANSVQLAPSVTDKVWKAASDIGYGNFFVPRTEYYVGIDDHVFVNKAGIPCVDIIQFDPFKGGFASYHHTHNDNMDAIDRTTLKAVGQTVLQVIWTH